MNEKPEKSVKQSVSFTPENFAWLADYQDATGCKISTRVNRILDEARTSKGDSPRSAADDVVDASEPASTSLPRAAEPAAAYRAKRRA